MQTPPYCVLQGGHFHFRLRVPKARVVDEGRAEIWQALNTRCPIEAQQRAATLALEHKRRWSLQAAEDDDGDAPLAFDEMRSICADLGIKHTSRPALETLPALEKIDVIAERIQIRAAQKRPSKKLTKVLLGHVDDRLTLDDCVNIYIETRRDKWQHLDHDQQYMWRHRYQHPVDLFKEMVGNIDLLQITRTHAAQFESALEADTIKRGKKRGTNAKKVQRLNQMIDKVLKMRAPEHLNPFKIIKIEAGQPAETREPMTEAEVLKLEELSLKYRKHGQLRALVRLMPLTGCNPSELTMIAADDIRLDDEIPHLILRKNENRSHLKTKSRFRTVPLVQEAVETLREFPNGFPAYNTPIKTKSFCEMVNKYIHTFNKDRTVYCLRHTFTDRLRRVCKTDTMIDALTGHGRNTTTSRYGDGWTLKEKWEVVRSAIDEANSSRAKLSKNHV